MTPTLRTKKFIVCPECNQCDWCVQHLIDEALKRNELVSAGPWFCDHCGYGFTLAVTILQGIPKRVDITIEARAEKLYKEWVIVDIPPQAEPIRLIVENKRSQSDVTQEHIDLMRFRFEENTALENILSRVTNIKDDLKINPKLIGICVSEEEVDQLLYGDTDSGLEK